MARTDSANCFPGPYRPGYPFNNLILPLLSRLALGIPRRSLRSRARSLLSMSSLQTRSRISIACFLILGSWNSLISLTTTTTTLLYHIQNLTNLLPALILDLHSSTRRRHVASSSSIIRRRRKRLIRFISRSCRILAMDRSSEAWNMSDICWGGMTEGIYYKLSLGHCFFKLSRM